MNKTKAKKATAKRKVAQVSKKKVVKKAVTAKKNPRSRATCKYPTTLFEVEFPTTLLFWAGVALFFFIMVLIAKNII